MDQSITLKIAGATYSLKAASPEMEQRMRQAAADVNALLARYEDKFPDRSQLDRLSFVALNLAIAKLSAQKEYESLINEVNSLNDEISNYLESLK